MSFRVLLHRAALTLEGLYRGIAQLVEQRSPKPRAEGSSPSAPAIGKSPKPQQLQGFRGFFFLPKKLKMQQNMPKNCSKSGTNLVHAWGNRGEFSRRKNGCKPSNTNGLQSSPFSPAGGTRGEKARKTLKKPVWIPIYTIFQPAIEHRQESRYYRYRFRF